MAILQYVNQNPLKVMLYVVVNKEERQKVKFNRIQQHRIKRIG